MGPRDWWRRLRRRTSGDTPEQRAILAEIDRIAAETGSGLPLVHRYRHRLEGPVGRALQAARRMTAQIPGPVTLDPDRWQADTALRVLFVSPREMRSWLAKQAARLPAADGGHGGQRFALLLANHRRREVFVTEQSGEIVRRDVPRRASIFENLRLVSPGSEMEAVRSETVHRILMTALLQAMAAITRLKEDKERLEREHERLEFVVQTAEGDAGEDPAAAHASEILVDVHRRLEDLERQAENPEGQLRHVIAALTELATRVHMRPVAFHLTRGGTLVSTEPAADSIGACTLAECRFAGREPQVAIWAAVPPDAATER